MIDSVGEALDPLVLMQRVTDRTLELIEAADGVMVGLVDDDGVTYVCGAGHQISHLGTRVGLDSSLTGLAVRRGMVQRSDDTAADPRVDADACRRLSVASLLCVPLLRTGETLGVLAVNARRAGAFSDGDAATLTQLGDFLSVAIGSACELSRASRQLLELSQHRDPADTASRYVMNILNPDSVTRIDSGERIRAVLDDPRALSVVFQPIVDVASRKVAAVEALARFDVSPYRPPDLWFAEAHQVDLGVELELLAITRALVQLPRLPAGVALTINVDPRVVASARFKEVLNQAPYERLILELTEHASVDDYPGLIAILQDLRYKGARLAIDDTGSGYSSLAHILKLAPDFIKLDRELVSGIDVDPVRRALAASLLSFASDTGAQIIAEGVETEDELEVLSRLGAHYAQGYHLGRPTSLLGGHSGSRSRSPRQRTKRVLPAIWADQSIG
ncbi:MAG TPA: EAL domain-containing protein [Acidimicrobiales bacterium]|nr:EAL domain-containing protein [Acidimicrobiales bacterium]